MGSIVRLVMVGMMSTVVGTGVSATDEGLYVQPPEIATQEDGVAVFPENIQPDDGWNKENPTQRKDGVYEPGKLEDGVWEWEFIPNDKSVDNSVNRANLEDFIREVPRGISTEITSDAWL